ncbi:MAG: hypothetical protein OXR68_06690 [Alphaproteobacteria bacterium]|nr:hypothetical protein [Alphaproteobacteria bacterium]MDD9920291.1 hypothetical protein [Alphaproteobacteria bacterium]
MVLKRKLPSKLTQEDDFSTSGDAFAMPDPIENQAVKTPQDAAVDVFADDPVQTNQPTPEKQEEQIAPPPPIVEEPEISEEPENLPKSPEPTENEAVTQALPPEPVKMDEKVPESSLKRQVKKKRNRKGKNKIIENKEVDKNQPQKKEQRNEDEPNELMVENKQSLSQDEAATKVANSMADIRGEQPNPAEEEIEAAYEPLPAETEAPGANAPLPKIDLPLPEEDKKEAKQEKKSQEKEPETVQKEAKIKESKEKTEVKAEEKEEIESKKKQIKAKFVEEESEPAQEESNEPVTSIEKVAETQFASPPSFAETQEQEKENKGQEPKENKEDTAKEKEEPKKASAWDFSNFIPSNKDKKEEEVVEGSEEKEAKEEAEEKPPVAPEPDIFGSAVLEEPLDANQGEKKPAPPELPKSAAAAIGRVSRDNSKVIKMVAAGAVCLIVIIAIIIVRGGDKARTGIQKFGDSVADYQKEIPADQSNSSIQELEKQMENELDAMAKVEDIPLAPAEEELLQQATVPAPNKAENTAKIEFVDIDPEEADSPITAEGAEDMPEDISAVAKLQREISRLKAGKEKETSEDITVKESVQDDGLVPTKEQIQAELEAYRKALASASDAGRITSGDNFSDVRPQSTLPKEQTVEGPEGLPPSTAYVENPYNLPVIPEPDADTEPKVRTLNDFDLALFEPDDKRIRMPKGVQPRLSATDFPEVDVLSFVPDRGIIAANKGRQGVLLLGESMEGWELVGVYDDYAEFRNGSRQYILTRE